MTVFFAEDVSLDEKLKETMIQASKRAVEGEGLPDSACQLSVSFVEADEIHELNRDYRGVDSVTDVLSFPQYERDEIEYYSGNTDMIPDELMLGDVVICVDKAREQAEEFGHSFERELIYLFTHSIFHLLGYDHEEEDEKSVMREKEESVMDYLGIPRR